MRRGVLLYAADCSQRASHRPADCVPRSRMRPGSLLAFGRTCASTARAVGASLSLSGHGEGRCRHALFRSADIQHGRGRHSTSTLVLLSGTCPPPCFAPPQRCGASRFVGGTGRETGEPGRSHGAPPPLGGLGRCLPRRLGLRRGRLVLGIYLGTLYQASRLCSQDLQILPGGGQLRALSLWGSKGGVGKPASKSGGGSPENLGGGPLQDQGLGRTSCGTIHAVVGPPTCCEELHGRQGPRDGGVLSCLVPTG